MCVRVVLPRMSAYARVRLRVCESERVYVCVRVLERVRCVCVWRQTETRWVNHTRECARERHVVSRDNDCRD